MLTCWGVVPGTSFEMLSHTLGCEEWNSDEFMNVLSIRSSATERDAGTPALREYDIFPVAAFFAAIGTAFVGGASDLRPSAMKKGTGW